MEALPIEYTAVVRGKDGHEGAVDLESPGWMNRQDVIDAMVFILQPKEQEKLPLIAVDLSDLPDGTPRRLVYLSRVFGVMHMMKEDTVSEPQNQHNLFRLYCIGWKATIGGREVKSIAWIYPWQLSEDGKILSGSIVMGDDPPFIDDLIMHYMTKDAPHPEAAQAVEEVVNAPDATS